MRELWMNFVLCPPLITRTYARCTKYSLQWTRRQRLVFILTVRFHHYQSRFNVFLHRRIMWLDLLLEYVDNDLWEYVNRTPHGLCKFWVMQMSNSSFLMTRVAELQTKDIIYQLCNAIEVSIIDWSTSIFLQFIVHSWTWCSPSWCEAGGSVLSLFLHLFLVSYFMSRTFFSHLAISRPWNWRILVFLKRPKITCE